MLGFYIQSSPSADLLQQSAGVQLLEVLQQPGQGGHEEVPGDVLRPQDAAAHRPGTPLLPATRKPSHTSSHAAFHAVKAYTVRQCMPEAIDCVYAVNARKCIDLGIILNSDVEVD